ncbi:fatty acid desaturase family protein [Aquimarina sp. 433]
MKSKHLYIKDHVELFGAIQEEIYKKINFCNRRFQKKMFLKGFIYFSFTLISYSFIYQISQPQLLVLAYVVFGLVSMLFAFNFAHDFSHNTIFKKKELNHKCFITLYTMVGAHAEAWKERHVTSHHHAPNVEGYDTDLEITNLIRVVPGSNMKWFHRFQYLYAPFLYTTYSLFWVFIKDFKVFFSNFGNSKKHSLAYKFSFWCQKIVYLSYLVFLPMIFIDLKLYWVIVAFISMHMVQSLFLLFTFFMTHHIKGLAYPEKDTSGKIKTSWFMNQVQSSNDFYPFSRFANFIFGGFNNHIAHHLFPHIHHVYYPELNKILYKVLKNHQIIPNQTSYLGGVVAHLSHLKRLGIE